MLPLPCVTPNAACRTRRPTVLCRRAQIGHRAHTTSTCGRIGLPHQRSFRATIHPAQKLLIPRWLTNAAPNLPDTTQKKVFENQLEANTAGDSFPWTKQWYPVAIADEIDPGTPHRIEVLGKIMALWRTPEGEWSCLDDACPHRAASLSQGRIDKSSGCLTCSYHGWQFNSDGSCADIPQSSNPDKTCGLRRSSVRSYPLQVAQGLVWIYPESGAEARLQADATPLALAPEVDDSSWWPWMPWLAREATVSFDFILENGFDFSHAPFAHHGLNGIKRTNAARGFDLKVTKMDPKWGVEVMASSPFKVNAASPMVSTYRAPACYRLMNPATPPMPETMIVTYRTPVRPGVTKSFGGFWAKNPAGWFKALYKMFPPWMLHVNGLKFQDGDFVLLHEQERHVEKIGGWRKAFYLPDPTDAGVIAVRRWFEAAGDIPFPGGNKLGPELPRSVQLDHYTQHVAHCKHCQAGLRNLRLFSLMAAVAGVMGVISGIVGFTGRWLPSPQMSLVATAVGAALLALSWKVKQYIQGMFFYQDYVHPINH